MGEEVRGKRKREEGGKGEIGQKYRGIERERREVIRKGER